MFYEGGGERTRESKRVKHSTMEEDIGTIHNICDTYLEVPLIRKLMLVKVLDRTFHENDQRGNFASKFLRRVVNQGYSLQLDN